MKTTLQRLVISVCVLGVAWWTPVAHARREMLLDVTHGQQPSDTATDKTFSISRNAKVWAVRR